MAAFIYRVTIEAGAPEEADRALAERLSYEEDYGFEYTFIDWQRESR